jgi:hypothetical protein
MRSCVMSGNPNLGMAIALATLASIFLFGMVVQVVADLRRGSSLKEALFGAGKYKRDSRPIKRWAIAFVVALAAAVALILLKVCLMH